MTGVRPRIAAIAVAPPLDQEDPGSVRRFRLHLRDLRTSLEAQASRRSERPRREIPLELRRLWRASSRIRDADVQRRMLREARPALPVEAQDAIAKERRLLRDQGELGRRRLLRVVRQLATRDLHIAPVPTEVLDHYWHHVWSEVLEDREALDQGGPPDRVHRLRRRLKRERAILRLAAYMGLTYPEHLLEVLQDLNRLLGTSRDHILLEARLRRIARRKMGKGPRRQVLLLAEETMARAATAVAAAADLFRKFEPELAGFTFGGVPGAVAA